jgi:hypothetical protein
MRLFVLSAQQNKDKWQAEEQTITEETQEEGTPTAEPSGKDSCHIYMPAKEFERILKWAEYAAIE